MFVSQTNYNKSFIDSTSTDVQVADVLFILKLKRLDHEWYIHRQTMNRCLNIFYTEYNQVDVLNLSFINFFLSPIDFCI